MRGIVREIERFYNRVNELGVKREAHCNTDTAGYDTCFFFPPPRNLGRTEDENGRGKGNQTPG